MIILFLLTSFLELTIFLFAAITFVLAVRFFMSSRRRLLEEFPGIPGQRKLTGFGFDRSGFLIPKNQDKPTGTFPHYHAPASDTRKPAPAKDEIRDLRRQLQQQQQELSKAMEKISGISQSRGISEPTGNVAWEDEQKSETLRRQMGRKKPRSTACGARSRIHSNSRNGLKKYRENLRSCRKRWLEWKNRPGRQQN
jgi:hypothetical protein